MAVTWSEVRQAGSVPSPRSGHSFSTVGGSHVLFGGTGFDGQGRAGAFNDVYVCDCTNGDEFAWRQLLPPAGSSAAPPARARHAAVPLDDRRLLVYGGIDAKARLSDVWLLDIKTGAWQQVAAEGPAPPPRAHHTATRVGSRIYIFGGYAGSGKALGDLWVLQIGEAGQPYVWRELLPTGPAPLPRYDHVAALFPVSPNAQQPTKLLILGGRDSVQQFRDAHVLDLDTLTWDAQHSIPVLSHEGCSTLCSSIEAVPYHKVFSFGGKAGTMDFYNDVAVMDCGSKFWAAPAVQGSPPCARESCGWVFDAKSCCLIMFGGWANRWLGDAWKLNVSPIIGPSYACTSIQPAIGAVAGGTEITIGGMRFREGKIQVQFSCSKGQLIVDATFVNSETIKCKSPSHESFGALPSSVAVQIGGEGWTVNPLAFSFFANTAPSLCLAYGPGLLQAYAGVEMPLIVQAKDTCNAKRQSGGDDLQATVEAVDGSAAGSCRIVDLGNGQYEVFYRVPAPGKYLLRIACKELGAGGELVPIRGSPFTVESVDPWQRRRLVGATPTRRLGATLNSVGDELLLYGNEKSDGAVCHTLSNDNWMWGTGKRGEALPVFRKGHAAATSGGQLALFGGLSMEDGAPMNDLWYMRKEEGAYIWAAALTQELGVAPGPRGEHALVALDEDLFVFGGECEGVLLQSPYLLVAPAKGTQRSWVEPAIKGALPSARKGAAAGCSQGRVAVVFGGCALNEQGEDVLLNDTHLFALEGPASMSCSVLEVATAPPARRSALLQEVQQGQLLLYGGVGADQKPLHDAWLLDINAQQWTCLYSAAADAVSQGCAAVLHGDSLVCLTSAPGSSRFDLALTCPLLDVCDSVELFSKMKTEVPQGVKDLDTWVARQAAALEVSGAAEGLQQNFDKLLKVMDALYQTRSKRKEIDLLFDQLKEMLSFLSTKHKVNLGKVDKQLEEVRTRWDQLKKAAPQVRAAISSVQQGEGRRIQSEIERFAAAVKQYSVIFHQRSFFKWATGVAAAYKDIDQAVRDFDAMNGELRRLTELGKLFECADSIGPTADAIAAMTRELVMVKDTWDAAAAAQHEVQAWNSTLWSVVKVDVVEEGAKSLLKDIRALPKDIKDTDCFKGLEAMMKNYAAAVPLVGDLRSPAMRPRHWEQLMAATKVTFDIGSPSFTLGDLLRLELHKFEDEVVDIVDRSQKEEKLEQALAKLEETWGKVEFVFTPHRNGDVATVKMAEDDFDALEDNQVLVQGMMANRYMSTFRDDILRWNKNLMAVADVQQLMAEIQRSWAYLESLFVDSDEVKKELPEATQRFAKIDVAVRAVLKEFAQVRNCVGCCNKEGLLKLLETQQTELEMCEKALADYMESKRRAFPRFYFVSTADLLDILSNGNNPVRIMQHMSKCFQAIDKLRLDTDKPQPGVRPKALGMESCVGTEYVAFKTPLPLEGKVEVYMTRLIDKMRSELRGILKDSVHDYPSKPREKWLFDWPSQIILVVNQIFWCQEVEEAFQKMAQGHKGAMKEYNEFQVKQLTRLIEVTRTDLSKADRQKCMNMITIDAHSRDMVQNVVESGAADPECFQWASQLRFYWDSDVGDCRIRICDATFPYGYEYLGNGPRLVITPLTDRIYITATQACWLNLGTAPAGPAGTGKTETTKDLSAQLGKPCYVFNCAPEMDYRTMGDIFKGLAASGSWGCFDEFNRLVPEVLSVCSVQYKCVTDAQRRKAALPGRGLEYVDANGTKHPAITGYTFVAADGVEMPLEEGTSAFITMNPGYIGRAELPESLKALFRPITVVVPDRQLIMENMLMAEGFVTAKVLAKKFAALYFLLEDLLSPAKHYDWGLRAIKSVLVVAGGLLRSQEGQDEQDVLYRALRDLNRSKILAQDMVVFMGLLHDIFPGVDPAPQRDLSFEAVVRETAMGMGLEPEEDFVRQVVQLAELLAIRHCVFLMGPTGCGRSEVYRVLAKALTTGCSNPVNPYVQANNKRKVVIRDLNPKSISTQELYGYVNLSTREWKDGLLSCTMRELANIPDDNPKWIILDGDLDAQWIESMNSVMDDNRLLTLPSNERIRLLPHMKLIFEIRDLKYATPATATRAGILYISEGNQWSNMVEAWVKRVGSAYAAKAKWPDAEVPLRHLRELFAKYVPPTLFEMRKSFTHIVPLGTMNWVTSLLSILEGLLKPDNLPAKSEQALFEMAFVFAMVWAFGGALCEKDGINYRKQFDKWWKLTFSTVRFPQKGLVFDWYVNFKASKFAPWTDMVQDVQYDSSTPMSQVFVPTAETAALRYFLDMMVSLGKPIMFVGGAGVGKTQLVKGKLATLPEDMASQVISFNHFTDVASFQKQLELGLEKKAGVNYAPPGNKRLIYFVDDLNMPKLDAYETAMPISLIRQHLGWGHWFDRQKLTMKAVTGTQYVACMNPTAGSFVVDPRLQRLFLTLAVEFPGQDSLMRIYSTFLFSHLKRFSAEVQELGTKVLQAALALHEKVTATFRKTAINFHYEFTVRHLANVFQGLLSITPEQTVGDPMKLARLWLHESERVYADRLVSAQDVQTYSKIVTGIAKKFFDMPDVEDFYKKTDPKPLIFCHFASGSGERVYGEVADFKRLTRTLTEALAEYNETNAVMDLVLFEDAVKHVCRISRIISNPGGHALLVGVGGSGKQSLARLAAHMCGYSTYTIVISGSYSLNNFREDLQKMCKRAGVKGEGIMFLFTDSQIIDEKMLVYVNDLLASGEIPDLFPPEDKDEIINAMRGECRSQGLVDTNDNCWKCFIQRVRANLHVVLTASPVSENFRIRSQRFLATINSTVIDWFQPWNEASLLLVARKFLDDVELESEEVRKTVVDFMPFSFASMGQMCKKFHEAERRQVYTTPKTYLELIKLYKNLLKTKRQNVQEQIQRLQVGLEKLRKTRKDVVVLVEMAQAKAKEVDKKVSEADAVAAEVGAEKEKASAENAAAQVEADKCTIIAREVAELQTRCEGELAAAEPLVAQAEAALDTLNKKDLGEMKSLKKPPPGVDDITAVVLCLLENVPKDKSWAAAVKLMNNVDAFIQRLKGFKPLIDRGEVPKKSVDACRSYLELPHFNKETIEKKSKAAAGLCEWALNIVKYYDVYVEVEPKRQELAAANDKLAQANSQLREVEEKVAALNAKVQELEAQFDKAVAEKNAAIMESEDCQRRLGLANRLITALASEGERWELTVAQLEKDYKVLTGDMLLAAAFVSYAGPFTAQFRATLVSTWLKFLQERNAPTTPGISDPLKVLVDDSTVAGWIRHMLPSDPTSIASGCILTTSERWPLVLDPQLQAINWIKEKEKANLVTVRLGQPDLLRVMERAISEGQSVLIENMGETIDAVLSPVVTRATFKKGRSLYVKLGDKDVEYSRAFRLFLHTKLSNPHYPPEIQAETTMVNFTVTEDGLEDQLLALVVNKERPDLEETKSQLIIQNTEFTIKLKQLMDSLLISLSNAEGDLTENVALIESLEQSKALADEISEKVIEARETEAKINDARNVYRPVAQRGSMLFFLLNSLNKIHAFYQFSLNSFVAVYSRGIDTAPGGNKKKPQQITLEQLSRRVTAQQLGFNEVMEMARRSSQFGAERMSHLGEPGDVRKSNLGYASRRVTAEASHSRIAATNWRSSQPGLAQEQAPAELTPEQLERRLKALLDTCTFTVFSYTQRGLFDRDKLTVLSLLTFRIMLQEGVIDAKEFELLWKPPKAASPPPMSDDVARWLPEAAWAALVSLAQLPQFAGLPKDMEKNNDQWEAWAASERPEVAAMPGEWAGLPAFRRLLVLRALKPDRVPSALQLMCEEVMGPQYTNQEAFRPEAVLQESSAATPIFFILFPGYSPSKEVEAYARLVGRTVENGKLTLISMGQGQEAPAERTLDRYIKEGGWVFLDNVHLMQGWISTLERKLEIAAESAHPDFRCFFSAEPINGAPQAKIVPESILQNALKVSNEPPSDMKSNIRRALAAFTDDFCNRPSTEEKRVAVRSILFGLCFFHSLLLGRKKFGTGVGMGTGSGLGFNRGYSFNTGDLTTCGDVLYNYITAKQHVPWEDLRYMFGETFYGGHITDDQDRRLCNTYLRSLIRPELLPPGCSASEQPTLELAPGFRPPAPLSLDAMRDYVEASLPAESPIVYGMHSNAQLSLLTAQAETLFKTIMEVTVGGGSGGASQSLGSSVNEALESYLGRLPPQFNMVEIESRVKERTPYVVVALQEATRMNALLEEMRRSMEELRLGLDGALNFSPAMEALSSALAQNKVPQVWMAQMSTRFAEVYSLSAWYQDVLKRHEQLAQWTSGSLELPKSVWLPGLFMPKAFLTAVMQTYARQHALPLDVMRFMTEVTNKATAEQVSEAAADGCYIHGLCLEGARWDAEEGCLADSRPNELHPAMPVVWVRPVTTEEYTKAMQAAELYQCPVYTNMQRANVYSPLVSVFTLRTKDPASKWTLASAALLLQDDLA